MTLKNEKGGKEKQLRVIIRLKHVFLCRIFDYKFTGTTDEETGNTNSSFYSAQRVLFLLSFLRI